jgi:two-component system nitrogen regulation response regulator NtrX
MKPAAMLRGTDVGPDTRPAVLYLPATLNARPLVLQRLTRLGLRLATATDAADAFRLLGATSVALVVADLAGGRAALAAIRTIRAKYPHVPIAAVADPANPVISGEVMQAGALDLIPWPFEDRDVLTVLANARDLLVDPAPGRTPAAPVSAGRVVAQSAAMRLVVERARVVAQDRSGLLVCGEPGTGRSVVAKEVHELWRAGRGRAGQTVAWVVVDCVHRMPDDLERMLFGVVMDGRRNGASGAGFERIARTGALFEARGGTLYLRHVLDAPARVQARLARLMRDREAELVDQPGILVDLDVRIIASAEPGVDDAVADGRMRADLFERLSTARIDVPPLRQRRDDVPVLATLFLKEACAARGVPAKGISRGALRLLAALPWHGHARELRNLVDTLVRAVDRPVLQLDDLLDHASFESTAIRMDAGLSLRDAKARFERECISAVLARHHGRVGDAAKALGIQRTNLYRKVRQLKVARPRAARPGGR